MRYRPFGATGAAISNITLSLGMHSLSGGPRPAQELIWSALEAGVNSYRLETPDPVLAEVVGHAVANVDRKLLNISVNLGRGTGRRGDHTRRGDGDFSAEGMTHAIDRALHISGLGWIDLVLLEQPADHELPQSSLNALKAMRATERVRYLGVLGDGDVMDAYVSTGAFDVLATPYHVESEWRVRARIRNAREQDMAVMAYDYFPSNLDTAKKAATAHIEKKGLLGLFKGDGRSKKDPLAGAGTFAFLHHTANWDAESICLAHVMTDPSVASVLVEASDVKRLAWLATIPDRDLPPGLSAQIEMARVRAAQVQAA